jgi:hypothetical protein
MYPFAVQTTGCQDGGDARSRALLEQHQRLALPIGRVSRGGEVGDPSLMAPHSLSAPDLMSASSLHNRERMITAELLKHRQQQLKHHEQMAAMAFASRKPFALSMQPQNKQQQHHQDHHEDILKRAISQLSAISRHPLSHRSPPHSSQPTLESHNHRCSNSLYCAEQDLSLEKDICFGRGQRVQRRKANVAFRKIVATYQETYDQAVSREDKKAVVKKVSRIFSRTGYRFFKECEDSASYSNTGKMWIAVSDHHVEYKIGHSFRSGRKQLKQQKNQRKQKICIENSDSSSSDAQTNKKSEPPSIVVKESSHHCVFKEEELSDKCICIGDKREKYTGMEAYQYFREFILTFKSIFGTSESIVEKRNMVTSLIEQIKTKKGYRFLKLMPLKKDVEFWVEASADDIHCEVVSILGNQLKPKDIDKQVNDNETAKDESSSIKDSKKRSADASDNIDQNTSAKRQCLSPSNTLVENCSRPDADFESNTKDEETKIPRSISVASTASSPSNVAKKSAKGTLIQTKNSKSDLVSSSSQSTISKAEELMDARRLWKKTRKRTLPEATKTNSLVPSEIIFNRPASTDKIDAATKNGTISPTFKSEEMASAIARQGMRVPSSLCLPSIFFGNISYGHRSERENQALADMASSEKILVGKDRLPSFGSSSMGNDGRATLHKALRAMRSSGLAREERALAESTANLDQQIKMKAKLLERLRQQELLYMEKKHKLAMLDLQIQSRNGKI